MRVWASAAQFALRIRVWLLVAVTAATVAGCAAPQGEFASDAAVAAARYSNGGAPELTLVTIMNYQTGNGDHTALFINGTERVLFDPAGSWKLDGVPERNDVHFGIAPRIGASFYLSHVRASHYAVVQRLRVTPQIAEQVKAMALAVGPVAPARCALETSRILQQIPGFESLRVGWYPHNLMRGFAALPGVMTYEIHHDAPDALEQSYRVQTPL